MIQIIQWTHRVRLLLAFAIAVLPCVVAARQPNAPPRPVTWTPSLQLDRLAAIDERMRRPEKTPTGQPLVLRQSFDTSPADRTVVNCTDYLLALQDGLRPLTTLDSVQAYEFARHCFVLRDLKSAVASQQDWLPPWSSQLVSTAPVLLEWGEREDRTPGQRWFATGHLRVTEQTAETIVVEDDTATYELELLATGDFNRDGVADIAFAGSVSAKQGSLTRSDYYVLTRCGANELSTLITTETLPFSIGSSPCAKSGPH